MGFTNVIFHHIKDLLHTIFGKTSQTWIFDPSRSMVKIMTANRWFSNSKSKREFVFQTSNIEKEENLHYLVNYFSLLICIRFLNYRSVSCQR